MKIAVLGAGAMGCLFGGLLAKAGQAVWLIDVWPEHIEAIHTRGLIMHTSSGAERIAVQAVRSPEAVGEVDLVLLFVKGFGTRAAMQSAAPLLRDDTLVCTVQNGLGNVEVVAETVPRERILYGLTVPTSHLVGPGEIRPTFSGEGLTYLWPAAGTPSPRMREVAAAFSAAGLRTELTPEVDLQIWKKLVINTSLNPLTGITGLRVGALWEQPEARALVGAVASEVARVARAEGIDLDEREAKVYVEQIAEQSREHLPSMLADVLRRQPTEIETLNGAVLRVAERHGIEAPATRFLYQIMRILQATYETRIAAGEAR